MRGSTVYPKPYHTLKYGRFLPEHPVETNYTSFRHFFEAYKYRTYLGLQWP